MLPMSSFLKLFLWWWYSMSILYEVHADRTDSVAQLKQVFIGNSNSTDTIVIGYVMDQLAPPYRIGAIQLALQNGQSNGLLPGYNFRYDLAVIKPHYISDQPSICDNSACWCSISSTSSSSSSSFVSCDVKWSSYQLKIDKLLHNY